MPVEWVIAPLEPALENTREAGWDRGPGAVIIGPAGVGKTRWPGPPPHDWAAQFDRVDWVTATAPAATIPFAAFSHLIEVPDTGKTAEVLRTPASTRRRTAVGGGRRPSVGQVVGGAGPPIGGEWNYEAIVAVAPNGPGLEEISALWEDDLLEESSCNPRAMTTVEWPAWSKNSSRRYLAVAHRVLEYLAVDDPLPLAQISELVSREAVAEAEVAGAVVVDDDQVRPAHPLFVDAVRDAMGGPELRRLRTESSSGSAPRRLATWWTC